MAVVEDAAVDEPPPAAEVEVVDVAEEIVGEEDEDVLVGAAVEEDEVIGEGDDEDVVDELPITLEEPELELVVTLDVVAGVVLELEAAEELVVADDPPTDEEMVIGYPTD